MKKLLVIPFLVLTLFGCSLNETPTSKVEAYLNNYVSLSDTVLTDLDTTVSGENLSDKNKSIYKEVLKRQYENLKYEIKDETINGDKANVKVKIKVYDLYKSTNESQKYRDEHLEDFNDDAGVFDSEKFSKYRLDEMLKMNDTIEYEVTFDLEKKDNTWVLQEPSREVLEKLHGLYNYEQAS